MKAKAWRQCSVRKGEVLVCKSDPSEVVDDSSFHQSMEILAKYRQNSNFISINVLLETVVTLHTKAFLKML